MLEVRGFQGLTYNTAVVGDLEKNITPPYDVISPEDRAKLAAQSPYNFVHVLLPEDEGGKSRYACAAEKMEAWLAGNAVVQDEAPHLYLLRQSFTDVHGQHLVRRGFFAAVSLPESEDNTQILGHERTFAKPVEDRLALMEATKAQLGPIFLLYTDRERQLEAMLQEMDARPADAQATTIDGVKQEFWRIDDSSAVTEFFKDAVLYIADGHHRFLTACTYRDRMRQADPSPEKKPYDYVFAGLVPLYDDGLRIYSAHRVMPMPDGFNAEAFLKDLEPWFEVTKVEDGLWEKVQAGAGQCTIGVVIHGSGNYLLRLRDIDRSELLGSDHGPSWQDLDVAVLHRGIAEKIMGLPEGMEFTYEKNVDRAIAAAESGEAGLAFLVNPVRTEQIRACARDNERMPQKSTYFFPKLPSGGVFHRLG